MAITKVTNNGVADNAITSDKISDGSISNNDLGATLDLSSKTVTLPSASVTAHATNPTKASIETLGIDVPATDLTGTIPDARFPATLPAISGANLTGLSTSLASMTDATVSASDPTVSSNKAVGHLWINKTSGEQFVCTDATAGDNVWTNTGGGNNIASLRGLDSSRPASGAQEIADQGSSSGAYWINNFTTGNTTQQVYCWIGANGDNWQKFAPFNNHMGMNHGHITRGCTGALEDLFSQTTANHGEDFHKHTGTSGCGGSSVNTNPLWGRNCNEYTTELKIMTTSIRQGSGQHQVWNYLQVDNSSPTSYNDNGSVSVKFANHNGRPNGERSVNIATFQWNGTMQIDTQYWRGVGTDYLVSTTAAPSSPDGTNTGSANAPTKQLWIKWNAWADYAPDSEQKSTYWVTT